MADNSSQIDVGELLKEQILDSVRDFAAGLEGDLQEFAATISKDAAKAALTDDKHALAHIHAQLRLLAAEKRIQLSKTGWRVLETTIDVGVALLSKVLLKI